MGATATLWDEAARYAAVRREAIRKFGAKPFLRGVGALADLAEGSASSIADRALTPERDEVALASDWLAVGNFLGGAITTANATVATTVSGTSITGGSITIVQSGSAAGQINSATPTALTFANEDDYISFSPSGASGSSIPATFFAVVQMV